MFSTMLELAGFAAFILATYLVAGAVGALYAGAPILLLLGYATDDKRASMSLARTVAPARRLLSAAKTRLGAVAAARALKAG